jgi:glycosyltransferase involved in cell wall biosynthesis
MATKIVIFSPDQHITYNLHTLNEHGVGGGVTVRVRMAHALAAMGNEVTLFVNCPFEGELEGVMYRQCSNFKKVHADVFIASTSGGGLDLSGLAQTDIQSKLKILFVHGVTQPKGLDAFPFDVIYAPSNFLRKIVADQWGVSLQKVFVTHHGVTETLFKSSFDEEHVRDIHSLIYAGHPSKGLETAFAVWRRLRLEDSRFSLHVFGGNQLWGQEDEPLPEEPGLFYHGLVGQEELASWMMECGFSLNLQSIPEAFGLALSESQRAGCVVLASPVGAYPELIQDGYDGCLVRGIHTEDRTREIATGMIQELVCQPGYMNYLRRNSAHSPLNWETVAQTWLGHWNWMSHANSSLEFSSKFSKSCPECNGEWLRLADGLHCRKCGLYKKSIDC